MIVATAKQGAAPLVAALLFATMAPADTDMSNLMAAERAALHREIHAILLSEPELIERALASPDPFAPDLFAQAVKDDLALIAARSDQLFATTQQGIGAADAPLRMALFLGPDCSDCDIALTEARALTAANPLRLTLFDVSNAKDKALADALGLDQMPSYVLPDMMIRGQMPAAILQRYLDKQR